MNFDELFRNTGEHGLSFLYRTLGCYHSLQPTRNAFESPSIPCLTDDGYVRWQTLQMLLNPDEHAAIIQKAVEYYDVPRAPSGTYPKAIPRTCFPPRPDADMEKWHRFVTSQINADSYQRRIKYSPYQSPVPESTNSPGGYFARVQPARPLHRRGESRSEEELARMDAEREAARRRRSVPDIVSPGGTLYSDKEAARKARSRSANRPVSDSHRYHQRRESERTDYPPSAHRASNSVSSHRHSSSTSIERPEHGPRRDKRHLRDPSLVSRMETASDASSEDSTPVRPPRPIEDDNTKRRSRWGSSLMPSFFLSNNKRRHSSDGRVPTIKDDRRSPQRSESIRKYKTEGPEYHSHSRPMDPLPERTPNGVRFANVDNPAERPSRSSDGSHPPPPPPSSYRHPEAQPYYPPPQSTASMPPKLNYVPPTPPQPSPALQHPSGVPVLPASTHFEARKQGLPVRISTVSGVNGRRYAPPDARNMPDPQSPVMINRRQRTSSMKNPLTSTVI